MPVPSFMKDSGDVNLLNNDNVIYKSNRVFEYSYFIKQSKKEQLCVVKFNKKCFEDRNIECFSWQLNNKNDNYDSSEYVIKKIRLYVFARKNNSSLANLQTLIKYDYVNEKGRIFFGEQTGVLEDSTRIFLHQPRQYAFVITELNPFPEIRFPIYVGKEWKAMIGIPQNTIKQLKIDSLDKYEAIHRNFTYKVESKVNLKTKIGKFECYKIVASADGMIAQTNMIAYFNPKFGFMKIIYQNIDGSSITYTLDSVKDNCNDSDFK